jgi:hypothetical protein
VSAVMDLRVLAPQSYLVRHCSDRIRSSSVSIVSGIGLDDLAIKVRSPAQ